MLGAFEHAVGEVAMLQDREQCLDGVQRPAVISVNMFAAALAVDEFLARLHPFREEPNATWAAVEFSLASMELFGDPDEGICELMADKVGRGDVTPPLDMLELAERRAA